MSNGDFPGIRVTNKSRKRRGTRTPIYRRNGAGKFHKCGVREAAAATNTVTVEVAACGCGGYDASELLQCDLDLYEMEVCCAGSGGSFTTGWSKIKVTTGINFESDDYSAGVSFNQEDDNDLIISHPGEFDMAFTLYPLSVLEIGQANGYPVGTAIDDVIYAAVRCAPGQPCGDTCSESWYAVTRDGDLIYKASRTSSVTSTAITTWPAVNPAEAMIAEYQGRLFVLTRIAGAADQLHITKLSSYGAPTTWTSTTVGIATTDLYGLIIVGSKLYAYGEEATAPKIYQLDGSSGAATSFYIGSTGDGAILDAAACGRNLLAVGTGGDIFYSGGCNNTLTKLTTSPTTADVTAIASQRSGQWWIGTADGHVFYSLDEGDTWSEKTFSFTATGRVYEIVWANPTVGHLAWSDGTTLSFYTTFDGGKTWTDTEDRIALTVSAGLGRRIAVPCCTNHTINANNFLMVGENGGVGQIWQGSIRTC